MTELDNDTNNFAQSGLMVDSKAIKESAGVGSEEAASSKATSSSKAADSSAAADENAGAARQTAPREVGAWPERAPSAGSGSDSYKAQELMTPPVETFRRSAAPWARAHEGWFTCRMNEIYYREKIRKLKAFDLWLRGIAIVLASAGVTAAMKYLGPEATIAAGAVAALANAVSLLLKLPEQLRSASAMLPQYMAAGVAFRELYFLSDDAKAEDVIDAWKAFDAVHLSEAENGPDFDDALLQKSYKRALTEFAATSATLERP